MASPASPETTTVEPQPAAPVLERTCSKCDATKVVSPETWPYRQKRKHLPYASYGTVCKLCDAKRKSEYEARRGAIAADAAPRPDPKGESPGDAKAITAANKLDVALALKTGSRTVNAMAAGVLARIMEYCEDPDHEHHLWALELLAQRILPRKLYEELGGAAAGVGSLNDKRPVFQVNILPAAPAAEGRVLSEGGEVLLDAPGQALITLKERSE